LPRIAAAAFGSKSYFFLGMAKRPEEAIAGTIEKKLL